MCVRCNSGSVKALSTEGVARDGGLSNFPTEF